MFYGKKQAEKTITESDEFFLTTLKKNKRWEETNRKMKMCAFYITIIISSFELSRCVFFCAVLQCLVVVTDSAGCCCSFDFPA
jgi:hypothetical protein